MALLALVAVLASIYITVEIFTIVYNIFFHPLAQFPGPWWAGASYLHELYFDVIRGGQYHKQVEKMHQRYGQIVRITPEELSIIDPNFQEQRFGGPGARRERNERFTRVSASPTSILNTVDHDLHRLRRAPLNSFFSKAAITRFEDLVQSKVDKVVEKLKYHCYQGTILDAQAVYCALTTDVISHYAYGESYGFLDDDNEDFKNEYFRNISGFFFAAHVAKNFPTLARIMMLIPPSITVALHSGMASVVEIINTSKRHAQKTLEALTTVHGNADMKHKSIFQALSAPNIPPAERSLQRLTDEGTIIMLAGLETTARFLTLTTCHLLSNPEILLKLREELKTVLPTPESRVSWITLENLPYMSAVISEGLRCEKTLMFRVPRVILEPMKYKDWIIPAKSTLSASPYLLNNHPEVFPDPHVFRPERWIEARARGENLYKHLATFGKGSRGCLGMNLAYAELYQTIAAIVRNFDLELVDSSVDDIRGDRDFSVGFTKDYRFGIKIRVTKVLQE